LVSSASFDMVYIFITF